MTSTLFILNCFIYLSLGTSKITDVTDPVCIILVV
jgi:hypothetical protein